MATVMTLPSRRFVARVNTGSPEAKANYKALAQRNALALEECPWSEVADEAVKPSLVEHDFTKTFTDGKYDAFLMTGSYNSTDNTEVAYAGMAAYRFTLPAAYRSGSATLVKATLMLSRDRFLLPGLRVSAVLSDSATPSTSWATVRGDGTGCVKLAAQLANPAERITAAEQATGAVEVELTGLDATKKAYLWVYLTVEDYTATWTWYSSTQHRLYAIEGSGMIVAENSTVEFSANVAPDTPTARTPTTLKLVNLATKAVDATLTLSGPVYSMTPLTIFPYRTDVPDDDPATIKALARHAIITGDFDEYSVSGMPGLIVYDYENRQIMSFSEESGHEVPPGVKAMWRHPGVSLRKITASIVQPVFRYVPATVFAGVELCFDMPNSQPTLKFTSKTTPADVDFSETSEAVLFCAPHGYNAVYRFYDDRIDVGEQSKSTWTENGTQRSYEEFTPRLQMAFHGSVSSVTGPLADAYKGRILVAGDNTINGNSAAVKLITLAGAVYDYFVDLRPDDFTDFCARECWLADVGGSNASQRPGSDSYLMGIVYGARYDLTDFTDAPSSAAAYDDYYQYTAESIGYHLVSAYGKTNPTILPFAGYTRKLGHVALLLTGRFSSIGGVKANGAAVLMYYPKDGSQADVQIALLPLNIGPVKNAILFTDASSPLPLNMSHMLIDAAD